MVAKCAPPDATQGSAPQAPEGTPTTPTDVPQSHLYDDQTLTALEWLHALMHDKASDLRHRIQAADIPMGIDPEGYIVRQQRQTTTIRIGGIKYDA